MRSISSSKRQEYDAQIVATVSDLSINDGTLCSDIRYRGRNEEDSRVIKNGLAIGAIAAYHKFDDLTKRGRVMVDRETLRYIDKAAVWATEHFGETIISDVLDKRAQMILLVNSGGGASRPAECIVSLMEWIKSQGGSIHAFSSSRASSAALNIFGGASAFSYSDNKDSEFIDQFPGVPNERVALADTTFLEHEGFGGKPEYELPDHDDATRRRLRELEQSGDVTKRNLIRELLRNTLEQRQVDQVINRIDAARADASNTLSSACFCGSDLPGFVTSFCSSFEEMKSKIEEVTGEEIGPADWRTDPIAKFVAFSLIEEKLRSKGHADAALDIDSKSTLRLLNVPDEDAAELIDKVVKPVLGLQ